MMEGRVMRSTGSSYDIATNDGTIYLCRMRGKFRLDDIKETNPVAVGDFVGFELDGDRTGIIQELLPRKNLILRQSVKKTGHSHVLAANIDQAVLIATLALPRTSLGFIDRFLVTAESYGIPQMLIFNKLDLMDSEQQEHAQVLVKTYSEIGVHTELISAQVGIPTELKARFQGKVSLVAGHSGVGKTTFLNQLTPGQNRSTGEISTFSSKGKHTTTFAEMIPIGIDSYIIDTPGVKELGLVDMSQQELSDYFPEMRVLREGCKFGARCIHLREPGCAILAAIEAGKIAATRYNSYVSMLLGEDNRK